MATELSAVEDTRNAMRDWEDAGMQTMGPCPSTLAETNVEIKLPDGWISQTKLVWPKKTASEAGAFLRCPLIVCFHGGGFSACSLKSVIAPARGYAAKLGAVVACCSYKLIPDFPFPASMKSAWEVCAWLSDPRNLNEGPLAGTGVVVDHGLGFLVGGMSAGGCLTAVIGGISAALSSSIVPDVIMGLSPLSNGITGLSVACPSLVTAEMLPEKYKPLWCSREENADGVGMTTWYVDAIMQMLNPDVKSPWFSPLNVDLAEPKTKEAHTKRVYVQVCQLDPLRDDGVVYEQYLRDSGAAETKIDVIENENHTAWATPNFPSSHTKSIKEKTLNGMAWLLGREWDGEVESLF